MTNRNYRLGIDLGTNSIGWCAVKLDGQGAPCGVLDAGVRILTPHKEAGRSPKNGVPLAAQRRTARSTRRGRDRFIRRRERLVEVLVGAGLLPENRSEYEELHKLDPYRLRATALDQKLEPYELGRALFHLNQRRGFKSNRVVDVGDDDMGAVKQGTEALLAALKESNARTLGELLARWHGLSRQSVRFRPTPQGAKNVYDYYPTREIVASELKAIWDAQSRWHGTDLLSPSLYGKIERVIVGQRDLKKPLVGRCGLMPLEDVVRPYGFPIDRGERAPKAHPLFQRFRVLQDVCQLRLVRPGFSERHLSVAERDAIAAVLMGRATTVPFAKLRSIAEMPEGARLNYEGAGRKGFQPDETAAKLSNRGGFGSSWRKLRREDQVEVVERLLALDDEHRLVRWLEERFGLTADAARFVSNTRLPQGHCRFGRGALSALVALMESESREAVDRDTGEVFDRPLTYDEAVAELGLHHSDRRSGIGGQPQRLPYYGEALAAHVISDPSASVGSHEHIGRVANPTVHIGLNQLRRVVNGLIEAYGKPDEIVIELARDLKLSAKQKRKVQERQREGRKQNEMIRQELASLQIADTHHNRMLLRLYYDLPAAERCCVYSGKPIAKQTLFSGSIERDHILPHSRTLDDSFLNQVLCSREANRHKSNRTPAETWNGDDLAEIAERAMRIAPKKAWRFGPDALEKLGGENGFLARHLTDTRYLSRIGKTYLELVCGRVWASPGRLTAMLRSKWGLNGLLDRDGDSTTKNRLDHRHHAVDAFVIACTDKKILHRVSTAAGHAEEMDLDRLYPKNAFPIPFEGFRGALSGRLDRLIVSHKADHGVQGRLLEDTAYGRADDEPYNLVRRKPLAALRSGDIERIRDPLLRDELLALTEGLTGDALADVLRDFGVRRGVRRVRLLEQASEQSIRVVRHGGRFEKAYKMGANHRIEIYELPNGTWKGEGVTVFDANQDGFVPSWRRLHPHARHVMSAHKGDLIEADFDQTGRAVYRVASLESSAGRLRLAPHFAAGSTSFQFRKSYSKLKAAKACLVHVDAIGALRRRTP